MSKNDKIKYVNTYFQETLESALSSSNEELKSALCREGITEDEQKELLISCIQGDEVAKIKGSKCANTAALSGIGVTLNFTDSNVWKQLKADMTGYRDWETDRKSTRLNSSHSAKSRMPSSA